MNSEENKLIADAHGWTIFENEFASDCSGGNWFAYRRYQGWDLSDAGAFRVLVESGKGGHIPSMILYLGQIGDDAEHVFRIGQESFQDINPHEAIAQARLAQLKTAQEDG